MAGEKVLHVVASMEYGGIQTWLIDLIRTANKHDVKMDILTYDKDEKDLAVVAKGLGCGVNYVPSHRNMLSLFLALRRVNRAAGGYDAIHAHNSFQNGLVLAMARVLGIPIRISHSHNAPVIKQESAVRKAYNAVMRRSLPVFSTNLLAVSNVAGEAVYGRHWGSDRKSALGYCGRGFDAYRYSPEKADKLRQTLGLPPTAKIVGHVGRFHPQKNHRFLVEIFAKAAEQDEDLALVLVGAGDAALRQAAEDYVRSKNLQDRVVFLGARSDANILLQTFDLFILPSLYEGLPLVVLEALTSGRKCLLSNSITHEVDAIPALITRLELDAGADAWADEMVRLAKDAAPVSPEQAYAEIAKSEFSIENSFQTLYRIYSGGDMPQR